MVHGYSVLWSVIAAFVLHGVSSACDLSLRDQLLLIRMSEAVPAAGATETASLVGEDVDCAELGSFRIVRHQGSMYFLDPRRAFERWSRTGVSIAGGPLAELHTVFYLYRRRDLLGLWKEYGRGPLTQQELDLLSSVDDSKLLWRKVSLLGGDRYRAAVAERASQEEESAIRLLLMEKAQWYVVANEPSALRTIDIEPGEIRRHSTEAVVTVTYQGQKGAAKRMVLYAPINTSMPPYVGYPIRDATDMRNLRRPLAGSIVPPK